MSTVAIEYLLHGAGRQKQVTASRVVQPAITVSNHLAGNQVHANDAVGVALPANTPDRRDVARSCFCRASADADLEYPSVKPSIPSGFRRTQQQNHFHWRWLISRGFTFCVRVVSVDGRRFFSAGKSSPRRGRDARGSVYAVHNRRNHILNHRQNRIGMVAQNNGVCCNGFVQKSTGNTKKRTQARDSF